MNFPQLLLFSAIFQYLHGIVLTYSYFSHSDFQLDPALSGKQFSNGVVFEAQGRSTFDCFAICHRSESCVAVTVTSPGGSTSLVTCRGFQEAMTGMSASVPDPNTAYYALTATINPWLKFPCSDNAACEGLYSLAECFSGECLCPIGYSYSVSRSQCYIGACNTPDQQQLTFVTYPSLDLWYYELSTIYNVFDVNACQPLCVAAHGISYKSVVYNTPETKCLCKNSILTPQNFVPNSNNDAATYIQPMCA